MLTIVNTLNKKQIQKNQELKELDAKNSDKEIQFVHPQIGAQRNVYLFIFYLYWEQFQIQPVYLDCSLGILVYCFFFFFFLIKLLIKRKKNLVIDFLFRDGCIYYQINLCHFIHPMYLWHFECM